MNCSENMIIENINVYWGVGLSIGSVSSTKQNCIRNITFQNIKAIYSIKFIYIKTGGIDNSTYINGIIENIVYRNMSNKNGLLWNIYIGPQQQKEPDGTGEGIWPDVNPYVIIRNILLQNVYVEKSYTSPGVIRCNKTNPCQNITFQNVTINSVFKNSYICTDKRTIQGTYDNNTNPKLNECGMINI